MDSERPTKEVSRSRKHSIVTQFPRTGKAVPRAEKLGDLKTADHISLQCVVEQDLATHWIQSSPCKTKSSQETEKSVRKFLEPSQKPKNIYTEHPLEFAKPVKIFPGIIELRHLIDPRQMVLLKEPYDE